MAACDFCSKHGYEVEGLVFSRLGHKVCKDCLLVCEEILEGEREPKPIPSKYEVAAPTDIPRFLDTLPHRCQESLDWCVRRVRAAMERPAAPLTLNCGFCGGKGRVVAGPRVMICASCVDAGRTLLTGDHARLAKRDVPQCAATVPALPVEPDGWDECSMNQLVLLAIGMREELWRRHGLAVLALRERAASVQPDVTSDDEFPHCGVVPEAALSLMNRMTFDCFAPGRLNINLIGGTGAWRRRLARRIHEVSRCGRRFVSIDCRIRGWITELMRVDGGTLFLDHLEALPPDGLEQLDTATRVEQRTVDARLVTGGSGMIALRGVVLNLNDGPVPI